MKIYTCTLLCYLCFGAFTSAKTPASVSAISDSVTCILEEYTDPSRSRKIPVAFYIDEGQQREKFEKIAILSHGYSQNQGDAYLEYNYLTHFLAASGYFVVSIQHELPTDELLAMEGNFLETRMPNWKRGMENIHFVLSRLKEQNPSLEFEDITLIGHSNGGDMSVLFAHEHPLLIHKVISLDNRRMPLPRVEHPRIYSIRSNDYPADDGVLPTDQEATKFKITVQPTDINHSSMDDDATPEERRVILNLIQQFLEV